MRPYPKYKPSGVAWLGKVPEHWQAMRLRDCIESCTNGIWGDDPDGSSLDIPVIRVADLDRTRRVVKQYETIRKIDPSQKSGRSLLPGDLLMEKSGGGDQQPVGMVVSYMGPAGAVCSNFVARMPARKGCIPRFLVYLHYYLYSAQVTGISIKQTTGIQNLDAHSYLTEPCYLPSESEQQTIADYLDKESDRIDELIREKLSLNDLLSEAKSSLISELVTGELLPGKPSGCDWIPHLPNGWQLKKLKHLGQIRSGLAKGKDFEGKATLELPYLRVANVQDGYLNLSEVLTIPVEIDAVERYSLKPGDVLMNEGGDYDKLGRGAVWNGEINPCLHQNHVFAVRPYQADLSIWLSAVTQTRYAKFYFMNNAKQSTNLASISQTNLKELPVLLPSDEERTRILEVLKRETAVLDDLITHTQDEINLLKELRTATIADAVLGRIDVRTGVT